MLPPQASADSAVAAGVHSLRGMLGSCNQLAITLGILLVYVMGLTSLGLGWRNLAFVGVVPSAVLLLLALTVLPGATPLSLPPAPVPPTLTN
jgi:hypothetical protein